MIEPLEKEILSCYRGKRGGIIGAHTSVIGSLPSFGFTMISSLSFESNILDFAQNMRYND